MSASEEEAFESAEEGESGKAGGKASPGKLRPSGESSKAPPNEGGDKGGGKQKGKQQQRKTKAKAAKPQVRPAADKKPEKPGQKNPAEEKPQTSPCSGAQGGPVEGEEETKDPKEEAEPTPGSPGSLSSEPVKSSAEKSPAKPSPEKSPAKPSPEKSPARPSPEKSPAKPSPEKSPTRPSPEKSPARPSPEKSPAKFSPEKSPARPSPEKSPAKPTDSGSEKQGSVTQTEKDSHKETQEDRNPPEKAQEEEEKVSETDTSAASSETQGKTAGEIRQSLTSNTGDTTVKNPADQSIPRESGDALGGSAQEKDPEVSGTGSSDGGGGSWNWGWGSSLLNAATNSLETFSSQVGEGLNTIIDSVESSFGVPDPENLARADSAVESESKPEAGEGAETVTIQPHEKEGSKERQPEKDSAEAKGKEDEDKEEATEAKGKEDGDKEEATEAKAEEDQEVPQQGSGWLSGWGMSSISHMGKSLVNKSQNLMNTGFEKAETLAAGGLDILETIGKKTYTTLTDHDPGLRRAREFLHPKEQKPSLSSVLREAQEQAEEDTKHSEELEEARKFNFTALFEDNQGLAHLEALEMLSNQSERKVQSLLSAMDEETLESIRLQLLDIKDVFQNACEEEEKDQSEETEHDFSKLVTENLSELHLGTVPDKLNKVQETVRHWVADFCSHEDHSEISDPKEVQQCAIQSLADVTSKAVEQFHKAGELFLMQRDEEKSYTHRAQCLAKLCRVLVTEMDILANKFSHCLNKLGEEKGGMEEVSPMVTSVFLEASNASGYIQDAFQLLLPVLQHAAIQSVL